MCTMTAVPKLRNLKRRNVDFDDVYHHGVEQGMTTSGSLKRLRAGNDDECCCAEGV